MAFAQGDKIAAAKHGFEAFRQCFCVNPKGPDGEARNNSNGGTSNADDAATVAAKTSQADVIQFSGK